MEVYQCPPPWQRQEHQSRHPFHETQIGILDSSQATCRCLAESVAPDSRPIFQQGSDKSSVEALQAPSINAPVPSSKATKDLCAMASPLDDAIHERLPRELAIEDESQVASSRKKGDHSSLELQAGKSGLESGGALEREEDGLGLVRTRDQPPLGTPISESSDGMVQLSLEVMIGMV